MVRAGAAMLHRAMANPSPIPTWKFWHPLPLWKAIVAFAMGNVILTALWVALRHGAGLAIPEWMIGGFGALVGFVLLNLWKRHAS